MQLIWHKKEKYNEWDPVEDFTADLRGLLKRRNY